MARDTVFTFRLQAVDGITPQTKKINRSVQKSVSGVVALGNAGRLAAAPFRALRGQFIGLAAAIGGLAAIRAQVNNLTDFNSALAEVKTISDEVAESTEKFRDQLIGASSQFGGSAADQAKTFYQIISAGITDASKANDTLIQANKLAIGGLTSSEVAVDALTTAINSYGQENLSAERAADILFGTVRLGKTRVDDLASSIGNVLPTAKALGVSFEQVSAGIAVLTTRGRTAAIASTELNAIFTAVLKNQDKLKGSSQKLKDAFSVTALRTKELDVFLRDLFNSLGRDESALTKLLGRVEGSKAILSFASDDFKSLGESIAALKEAGAAEAAFKKATETISAQASILKARLSNIVLAFTVRNQEVVVNTFRSINEFLNRATSDLPAFVQSVSDGFNTAGRVVRNFLIVVALLNFRRIQTQATAALTKIGLQFEILAGRGTLSIASLTRRFSLLAVGAQKTRVAIKLLGLSVKILKAGVTLGLSLAIDVLIEKLFELREIAGSWAEVFNLAVLQAQAQALRFSTFILNVVAQPIIKVLSAFPKVFNAIKAGLVQLIKTFLPLVRFIPSLRKGLESVEKLDFNNITESFDKFQLSAVRGLDTVEAKIGSITNQGKKPLVEKIIDEGKLNNATDEIKTKLSSAISEGAEEGSKSASESLKDVVRKFSTGPGAGLFKLFSTGKLTIEQGAATGVGIAGAALKGASGATEIASQLGAQGAEALLPGLGAAAGPLITALAQGPEKVKDLVNAFINATPAIIENVLLAVPQLIISLSEALPQIITKLAERAPIIIRELLKKIPEVVASLATAMPRVANALAFSLIQNAPQIAAETISAFVTEAPRFVDALIDNLVGSLGGSSNSGIASGFGLAGGGVLKGGISGRDSIPAILTPDERIVDVDGNKDLTEFLSRQNRGQSGPSGDMGETNALLQNLIQSIGMMQPSANVIIGEESIFNAVNSQLERGREFSVA